MTIKISRKSKNALQASKKLSDVLRVKRCVKNTPVFVKFRSDSFDVEDAPRSGRLVEADKDIIKALVDANRRITTREIGERFHLSYSTVYDHSKVLSIASKLDIWIPHVLTERNLCRRFDACDSLLKRHENYPFLKRIITGDNKWVLYNNFNLKRSWSKKDEPAQSILKKSEENFTHTPITPLGKLVNHRTLSQDCFFRILANIINGKVYDGNSTAAPLILKKSGKKPEGLFTSTGNQMLVKLVANGNDVGNGFKAHYKIGCGGRLLADEGGMISSPSFFSFTNCSWIIYAADPGDKVSLIVTRLHMPEYGNCSSSNLRILDGDRPDSPLIEQLCGFRIPPPILSRGSILHVMLQTGSFKATYGLASTHCGGVYHSKQGTFGSPGYPNNYDMDIECVWTIEAAVGNKLHLSFQDFNLEDSEFCNKDYVEIHENDESGKFIGRYCGNRVPANLTDAPKLWIKFRTDDVEMQKGFLAHFELRKYYFTQFCRDG
ncbi:cubilin [Trichonephila clavipes]|nr:cubilin [Trichonephila clavipes]